MLKFLNEKISEKEEFVEQRQKKLISSKGNKQICQDNQEVMRKSHYQPSRKSVDQTTYAIYYKQQEALNDLESQLNNLAKVYAKKKNGTNSEFFQVEVKEITPKLKKVTKANEFIQKPMKRQDSNMEMFKTIFIEPKENKLKLLSQKQDQFHNLATKQSEQLYDKLLDIYDENKLSKHKFEDKSPSKLVRVDSALQMNSSQTAFKKVNDEIPFFDLQIQMQAPVAPNASNASPLNPGNGWAPSIPYQNKNQQQKLELKDLNLLQNAGQQARDIQKLAHSTYLLANYYEQKHEIDQSNVNYKKFIQYAKQLDDKIGVALALNRLGVNYFKQKQLQISLEYHEQNLQLSDRDNQFTGFYNLGIIFRLQGQLNEALNQFNQALEWTQQRQVDIFLQHVKEMQSMCLVYAQLGLVYFEHDAELAQENLNAAHQLSVQINNPSLNLNCLILISKLQSNISKDNLEQNLNSTHKALQCADSIGDLKNFNQSLCNIGLLQGNNQFKQFQQKYKSDSEY